jgi:hypothetical protein
LAPVEPQNINRANTHIFADGGKGDIGNTADFARGMPVSRYAIDHVGRPAGIAEIAYCRTNKGIKVKLSTSDLRGVGFGGIREWARRRAEDQIVCSPLYFLRDTRLRTIGLAVSNLYRGVERLFDGIDESRSSQGRG